MCQSNCQNQLINANQHHQSCNSNTHSNEMGPRAKEADPPSQESGTIIGSKNGAGVHYPPASSSSTAIPRNSSLCCASKKPESGAELGVWEESLEDRAGIFSRWLLSYLNPLLAVGSHKVLDAQDIGVPPTQDKADRAYASALKAWQDQSEKCRAINEERKAKYEAKLAACNTEQHRKRLKEPFYKEPSIAWALVKAFGLSELFVGLIYYVFSALLTFLPVIILSNLVRYFETGQRGYVHPWVEVLGLGVIPFTVSLLQTRHQTIYAHCAVFCRTAVSTLLYRKALRVSSAGRAVTSTGQVVNMMSNDTAQLQRFLQFVGMTITAPLQIVLALVLIYRQVRSKLFAVMLLTNSSGWKCDLGWSRIYGLLGAHQHHHLLHRDEAATEGVTIFRSESKDDERNPFRNSNYQTICVGTTV